MPFCAHIYYIRPGFDTSDQYASSPSCVQSLHSPQASPAMYAAGHHVPDPLRLTNPFVESLPRADSFAEPSNAWQHPASPQYRDPPPIPAGSGQQSVPSPLSSRSIPSGDSPEAYLAHRRFHQPYQLPHQHPQDGQRTQTRISAHQRTYLLELWLSQSEIS